MACVAYTTFNRFSVCLFVCLFVCLTNEHLQPRRRRPAAVLHAANAAPSRNLGKAVVAVAVALGSGAAEVLVTQNLVTRGTRVSGSAKHGHSSRLPWADSQTLINS